jgi:hypothetical protein
MHENKTFLYIIFAIFWQKLGILILDLYFYGIKVQTDINQNTRKNHNFFKNIFWVGPDPVQQFCSGPVDTIQARSNSDFDIKCATIQFYGNSHNSRSDRWIRLKVYIDSPDMFFDLGFTFQVNRSSGRHHDTCQQRLYEFCYLLSFDLWTSYLARILFLKGCGSLFWEYPNSTRIFNKLQYSFPSVARIY